MVKRARFTCFKAYHFSLITQRTWPGAGHAGAGGARNPEISLRMSANICRGTATSAIIWNVT